MKWTTNESTRRRIWTSILLWLAILLISAQIKPADAASISYGGPFAGADPASIPGQFKTSFNTRTGSAKNTGGAGFNQPPGLSHFPQGLPPGSFPTGGSPVFQNGSSVPLPPSAWLFITGLAGLVIVTRRQHI